MGKRASVQLILSTVEKKESEGLALPNAAITSSSSNEQKEPGLGLAVGLKLLSILRREECGMVEREEALLLSSTFPLPPFWCNPCTQKTEAASPPPSSTHSHFCGAPLPFSGEWLEGRGGGKKGGGGGGAGRHPNSTFKGRGDLERRRRVSEGQKNVLEGGAKVMSYYPSS